jgi:hypothetical protein
MADSSPCQDALSSIIAEPVPSGPQPETESVEKESRFLDCEAKRADLRSKHQNIAERKSYAKKLFWLTAFWLFAVFTIVSATSASIVNPSWWPNWLPTVTSCKLSDAVLIALIGTTTANVLGLFVIVARYLFPDSKGQ